jgi:hypothetical protein
MPTRGADIGLGPASVLAMQFIGFFMFLDFSSLIMCFFLD